MRSRELVVTYIDGRPLAAYLYLPGKTGDRSERCEEHEPGLVVDFTEDGRAMGVEITSPRRFTLEALNRVLALLHQEPADSKEVAPLLAVCTAA